MSRSWKIAEVAGIGILVHWTFLILIAWIIFHYLWQGASLLEVLEGMAFIAAVFFCIVLHELGHALTARRFGIATRDITLLPIGGMARLERMPEDPRQELLVALAGPLVTFLVAAILLAIILVTSGPGALLDLRVVGGNLLVKLMWVNAILLGFNLLPAFPMDGGRVLRAALHFELDYVEATQIASAVGQAMAVLFGIVALVAFNPFLLLIALFVYFSAREESRSVKVRSLCRDIPVRDAMVTHFRALNPRTTIGEAARALLDGSQQDFPVVEDHRLVGMLSRPDLVHAVETTGESGLVSDAMRRECRAVDDGEMLEDTFQRMRENGCSTVPVVHEGELVGIVTLENVGEWIMVQTALRRLRRRDEVDDIYHAGD